MKKILPIMLVLIVPFILGWTVYGPPLQTPTISGGMDVNLSADDNILIDGATNPRVVTPGAVRQLHRPAVENTTAKYYLMYPSGYSANIMNLYIDYEGVATSSASNGMNIQVVAAGATNFDFTGVKMAVVGTLDSSATVDGMETGIGIRPIHQDVGGIEAAEQAWTEISGPTYTDRTAAFNSSLTNAQIFTADNAYIYVGHSEKFSLIEVVLAIVPNNSIQGVYQYWNGSAWATLTITNGTNDFQQSGNIIFTPPTNWGTTSVNGVTKYYVRIQRTRNSLSTVPTESTIRVLVPTAYIWDAEGDVNVSTLRTAGKAEIGDAGLEFTGVNIDGTIYTDKFRVNDFAVSDPILMGLHRHSTTSPANLVTAYSNSDTTSHAAVTNSQPIFRLGSTGYTGSHYDYFGRMEIGVEATGTISSTSSPGYISFFTVPNGSNTLAERVRISSAGDMAIKTQGTGLILRATDGANCFRVTVNNAGTLSTASVTCP